MYERMTCRLCGGRVWTLYKLTPTPIANLFPAEPYSGEFYPLELKQCSSCAHVQIGHVIDDATLYGAAYKYETPRALRPQMRKRADELRILYQNAENVLEIGANNGLFLEELRAVGFRKCTGIDPSSAHEDIWRTEFNAESANAMRRANGRADLILANNVFAHIDDLNAVFEAIDGVLSEDGAVVFEVQYLPALVRSGAFDMVYHEHRDYHHIAPLVPFLKRHGLVMTDWEIFDAHGGSVRITAHRNGIEKSPPDERMNWREFHVRIHETMDSICGQIGSVKISAFGAPAKAVTMIHHFGFQNKITYCVDDTPAKHGRYIAGTAIPVVNRTAMQERMLLLSWNYEAIIRGQFPGTEFIVPFAERERMAA